MNVKINYRKVKDGISNVYVSFPLNGKRERKRLDTFYIYDNPKTQVERDHNKRTKEQIEIYKAELTIKIQNNSLGIKQKKNPIKNFIQFFTEQTNLRRKNDQNSSAWSSTLKHLNIFCPNGINFNELNINWLESFKSYLTNNASLKSASANTYFNIVKHALYDAFREKLIDSEIANYVSAPKIESAVREILTPDEVIKLIETDCDNLLLKKAFIFSCMTGMSWKDIKNLNWENIRKVENRGFEIIFHRKKTKELQYHPITDESVKWLGWKKENKGSIFNNLKYNSWMNQVLERWVFMAEIRKKITFHNARHTYATLLLANKVDITVVKELMGHKDLKTTQIYAKVLGTNKRDGANKLKFMD